MSYISNNNYVQKGRGLWPPEPLQAIKVKNPYTTDNFLYHHPEYKSVAPEKWEYIYGITLYPYRGNGFIVIVTSLETYKDDNLRKYVPQEVTSIKNKLKSKFKKTPLMLIWQNSSKWQYIDRKELDDNSVHKEGLVKEITSGINKGLVDSVTGEVGDLKSENIVPDLGKYNENIKFGGVKNCDNLEDMNFKSILGEKGNLLLNELFLEIVLTDKDSYDIGGGMETGDGDFVDNSTALNSIKEDLIKNEIPSNETMITSTFSLTQLMDKEHDLKLVGEDIINHLKKRKEIADNSDHKDYEKYKYFNVIKGLQAKMADGYLHFWRYPVSADVSREAIINSDGYGSLELDQHYGPTDYITKALLESTVVDKETMDKYRSNSLDVRDKEEVEKKIESVRLKHYQLHYNQRIQYDTLKYLLFRNKLQMGIEQDREQLKEAELILKQEYVIGIQPSPKYIMWFLERLLMLWYYDKTLNHYVRRIKVLLNLYRAKDSEGFNKRNGVLPVIAVYPRYGIYAAKKVLSKLKEYFPLHNEYSWDCSNPTFFVKDCCLFHYTNGALDMKMYYLNVLKASNKSLDNYSYNSSLTRFNNTPHVGHKRDENHNELLFRAKHGEVKEEQKRTEPK